MTPGGMPWMAFDKCALAWALCACRTVADSISSVGLLAMEWRAWQTSPMSEGPCMLLVFA